MKMLLTKSVCQDLLYYVKKTCEKSVRHNRPHSMKLKIAPSKRHIDRFKSKVFHIPERTITMQSL